MHLHNLTANILSASLEEMNFLQRVLYIIKTYYPNILEGVGNTLLIS